MVYCLFPTGRAFKPPPSKPASDLYQGVGNRVGVGRLAQAPSPCQLSSWNQNSGRMRILHTVQNEVCCLFCFVLFPLLVGGWGGHAICNYNVLHMYSIYLLTLCLIPEKD